MTWYSGCNSNALAREFHPASPISYKVYMTLKNLSIAVGFYIFLIDTKLIDIFPNLKK
jgi:hypothetical protein